MTNDNSSTEEGVDQYNENANDHMDRSDNLSTQRCRKVQSLFQIMYTYYVHHCERRRTPMHIMNAESFHSLGRGGKIVTTIVNHEGMSLSYSELRRYQHDLTSFTAQHNKEIISLPRQFDPGQFTSGAINNWDHEGANVSEHDTVTVLFEDKPPSSTCKPRLSETDVIHGPQSFKETLKCQVRTECTDFPSSYEIGYVKIFTNPQTST